MKTLKDVYIKATKGNVKELNLLIKKLVIEGDNLLFESESIESVYIDDPKYKQKVSLSQLKRLIETIPTREEITRLKRQISAYKTNYDKVVKHSLSKEGVIEELDNAVVNQKKIITRQINEIHRLKDGRDSLNASYKNLNKMFDDLVLESGNKRNLLQKLNESLEKESVQNLSNFLECENKIFRENLDFKFENERLRKENERLKNKKWHQIW